MKRVIFLTILAFISELVYASSFMLGGAIDQHLERGMDQMLSYQFYRNIFGFYILDKTYFGAEMITQDGQSESGQQTYYVKRTRQMTFLEIQCMGDNWKYVRPYVSAGAGGYYSLVTTRFMGSETEDRSRFYGAAFGGLGAQVYNINPVFLAAEVRLLFAENYDPQPTISLLLKFGVEF